MYHITDISLICNKISFWPPKNEQKFMCVLLFSFQYGVSKSKPEAENDRDR